MSEKNDPDFVEVEGKPKMIGQPRKPQKSGDSFSVTVPMKELVRQAVIKGMDVVDFVANYELAFFDVTPEGGSWLRDGTTIIRWQRRKGKEKKGGK